MEYYVRLSDKTWLGANNKPVPFNDSKIGMKRYKTLKMAVKAACRYSNDGYPRVGVYKIDWSLLHTPITRVAGD